MFGFGNELAAGIMIAVVSSMMTQFSYAPGLEDGHPGAMTVAVLKRRCKFPFISPSINEAIHPVSFIDNAFHPLAFIKKAFCPFTYIHGKRLYRHRGGKSRGTQINIKRSCLSQVETTVTSINKACISFSTVNTLRLMGLYDHEVHSTDKVSSEQYNWARMLAHREFMDQEDKHVRATLVLESVRKMLGVEDLTNTETPISETTYERVAADLANDYKAALAFRMKAIYGIKKYPSIEAALKDAAIGTLFLVAGTICTIWPYWVFNDFFPCFAVAALSGGALIFAAGGFMWASWTSNGFIWIGSVKLLAYMVVAVGATYLTQYGFAKAN
ncbi:uncharacterized protein BCR38DRAFT_491785 [Pseudomassariella vexata]|uniref:VIT family-domain-containing protein n=1 Tax=Pseudomassariella vexata TaxID=1141098 RepID=A0A1Y2EHD7_9PEZI|nr:uncharacterized protein BCR38DRAFT_491785 [Pseudomassariella vexata]ORY70979.1 hypothetical protein BCR38DRAFT_491785 [Pseudomassariella vexata]